MVQCVRGASETGDSDIYTLFRTLCDLADHRIRIATAYFVPDADMVERLVHEAPWLGHGGGTYLPANGMYILDNQFLKQAIELLRCARGEGASRERCAATAWNRP